MSKPRLFSFSFLKIFFWGEPFLKSLMSLLQYCFCFVFCFLWAWGMWNLSSLTRDRTCTPCCFGSWSLNHWTTREVPRLFSVLFMITAPVSNQSFLEFYALFFKYGLPLRLFFPPDFSCFRNIFSIQISLLNKAQLFIGDDLWSYCSLLIFWLLALC